MFKIYFSDLNEEAQKEFLKCMHLDNAQEGNFDVFPIAILEADCEDCLDMDNCENIKGDF